ncbi:hypothetical protein BCR42DRAFT_455743 [Absidia repens]|uniref:Uncharacterized protein n=1 Tax=Absidia repens TaxID=90262 RepID=A0A1X2I372_9FUNG|nr:hypothetical protein BCR42DRAFT_455743 [Absidia repens]
MQRFTAFYMFGECIPARTRNSGQPIISGTAHIPALCSKYKFEDCKGPVVDNPFSLMFSNQDILIPKTPTPAFKSLMHHPHSTPNAANVTERTMPSVLAWYAPSTVKMSRMTPRTVENISEPLKKVRAKELLLDSVPITLLTSLLRLLPPISAAIARECPTLKVTAVQKVPHTMLLVDPAILK